MSLGVDSTAELAMRGTMWTLCLVMSRRSVSRPHPMLSGFAGPWWDGTLMASQCTPITTYSEPDLYRMGDPEDPGRVLAL